MELSAGRGREALLNRVRTTMAEEDRLVRPDTDRQIGRRLTRDEPGRARSRGATVLRPEMELGELREPSTPDEFDTGNLEPAKAA